MVCPLINVLVQCAKYSYVLCRSAFQFTLYSVFTASCDFKTLVERKLINLCFDMKGVLIFNNTPDIVFVKADNQFADHIKATAYKQGLIEVKIERYKGKWVTQYQGFGDLNERHETGLIRGP